MNENEFKNLSREERIRELERLGIFDRDVEDDPPTREILPDEIDYEHKTLWQRAKTKSVRKMRQNKLRSLYAKDSTAIKDFQTVKRTEVI